MKKSVYLILGHFFLILGIVGAFLPVLPTTPFLLLTAFCYSKSNTKLHAWIMLGLVIFFRVPTLQISLLVKWILITIILSVLIFIWSRPSRKPL